MAAISDMDFGQQLCKILKLDPGKVRNITIFNRINEPVMVQVDVYLQDIEAPRILKAMKDFVSDEVKTDMEVDGEKLIHFTRNGKSETT
jgi:hypothetical protein